MDFGGIGGGGLKGDIAPLRTHADTRNANNQYNRLLKPVVFPEIPKSMGPDKHPTTRRNERIPLLG
jgi:hypothetical protein